MVAVLYRPTLWGASASHLTDWRAGAAEYLYIRPANPKPAKSLVSQTPRRLGATHFRACTRAAVLGTRRTCRTGLPARQTTPAIGFAIGGDVAFTGNKSACKTGLMKRQNRAKERKCITGK